MLVSGLESAMFFGLESVPISELESVLAPLRPLAGNGRRERRGFNSKASPKLDALDIFPLP